MDKRDVQKWKRETVGEGQKEDGKESPDRKLHKETKDKRLLQGGTQ